MKSACLFGLTVCCQKKYGGVGMQKKKWTESLMEL